MKRVLLIRFSSLGDITLTLSSAEWLIDSGYEVHFLTKAGFRPLLETYGRLARIHTIPDHASLGELIRVARELRTFSFAEVRDLHRNLRSRVVTFLLGVPFRRIRKWRIREFLLFTLRRGLYRRLFHALDRGGEAVRIVAGEKLRLPPARLRNLDRVPEGLRRTLEKDKRALVCIAPESVWPQKEWAYGRFLEVAKQLIARGHLVVFLGLRAGPVGEEVDGLIDLRGRIDLREAASVLGSARLLVSNDSGLMHVAEAAGTPVVAVFGPTSRELGFGPRLPSSEIVESGLWCRPCSKTGRLCFRPVQRRKCLTDVGVEAVLAAVTVTLEKKKTGGNVAREDLDL